jgi:cell division protein FtsI/penicillin-binding protein 2
MYPKTAFVGALLCLFVIFAGPLSAQSKKGSHSKAADKKNERTAKDARRDKGKRKDEKEARRDKKENKKEKLTAKERRERDKKERADQARDRSDSRSQKDRRSKAEQREAAAERRRKEAERRQAILAEKRRREEAAREARARRLAFERGLRTETIENIGKDSIEGEDLAVRRAAVNALGSHAGSVVVMEAQTGKVLTIVNQDWAIRSGIKPCSTIKLVTGVAGVNEGVINKEDGSVRNTRTRRALDDAIAFSDNGYFQRVGSNLGNSKMIEYAKDLGLGEPTGLNAPGEYAGKLPYGNNGAKIYSHGEDFEVTPLQLAVLVSEISNGGVRLIPRIPRNEVEKTRFQPFMRERLNLPQQNVRRMIPGMIGAAEYGTAHRGVDASLGIAGKTGSCISKGSWVGLFASVAPIEQPKYAVVVITRGEHERGKYAAAVAGQVYRALSGNIVRDRDLARREFNLPARVPVQVPTKGRVVDDEDENEDDDALADSGDADDVTPPAAGKGVIMVPVVPASSEKTAEKKLVTRTGSSKPLFPPVVITFDKSGRDKKQNDKRKP